MNNHKSKHVVIGAVVSMLILILQMLLALVKVRLILTHYGHEYYSIFQSSNGVFSYLILIESGFSVAYLLKMYDPYAHGDYRKLESLYLGLEKMLYKVAGIMLIGVVAITIFYPMILAENSLGHLEVSVLIALCGIKFVLPYFFTVAKKQILNVVERSYLISIIDSTLNLLTDAIIIWICMYTDWSFLITVLASALMLIPSIIIYTAIINHYKKKFGFVKGVEPSYEASAMTKDIMAQKVAYLADNNVDQIILSTRDLLQATVYTSFNSVVSYPVSLTNQLISSFRGHMGVRLADDSDKSYVPFRKLLAMNFYIATVITSVFILQAQSFVKLWIGETYNTQNITLLLFAVILFRKCAENTITIAREGRDLYKLSKKYAIAAAIVNFVLSLILVQFIEIKGLLIATIIADIGILDFNDYRLVFHNIFNKNVDIWRELIPSIVCIGTAVFIRYFTGFQYVEQNNWLIFIGYSALAAIIVAVATLFLYLLASKYMRGTVNYFLPKRLKKEV